MYTNDLEAGKLLPPFQGLPFNQGDGYQPWLQISTFYLAANILKTYLW